MRCPRCQYELWNLREPVCPECGRGFELGEWDFSRSDAGFACVACGEALSGRAPDALPERCGACGAGVDREAVVVRPGGACEHVPRVGEIGWAHASGSRRSLLVLRGTLTSLGVLSMVGALGIVFLILSTSVRASNPLVYLVAPYALAGVALLGVFGLWPRRVSRRLVLVAVAALVSVGLPMAADRYRWVHHVRSRQFIYATTGLSGIVRGIEMYQQDAGGAFPPDPHALIGPGYAFRENFYPAYNARPTTLHTRSLPDGWVRAGDFCFDWNAASWQVPSGVVIAVATPPFDPGGVIFAYDNSWVDSVPWAAWPAELQRINADRAAAGLAPIPSAALPTPP